MELYSVRALYSRLAGTPVSSATTAAARRGLAPASTSRLSASSAGPMSFDRRLGRATDHQRHLAPRRLVRVARRQLGRRAADHLLVDLGQLARDRDRALGVERGQDLRATRRRAWATRTPRASPGRRTSPATRPSCGAGSRRTATGRRAARWPPSAASAADGPGSTSTASPAATHAWTSTNPGSETSGVPASETSATTVPSRILRHQLPGALALVVLVVADQLTADAVAVEQHARAPGVLAGHDVGLAQRGQHAQGDVLEVADRRRADDQPPRAHARASGPGRRRRAPPRRSSPPRRRTRPARSRRCPARAAGRGAASRPGPRTAAAPRPRSRRRRSPPPPG